MPYGLGADLARAALDRVDDAVLVIGPGQSILYANPAAETLLGTRTAELIGAHALLILPGEDSLPSMEPILERFLVGESWSGHFVQRRPDGSLVEVDVTAWPWGDVTETESAVVVMRESAAVDERDVELARSREQRAAVLSVMGAVRPEPTVEATTTALCRAIAEVDGIDGAMILAKSDEAEIVHVGSVGVTMPGYEFGSRVPAENIDLIGAMAAAGPWWLDISADSTAELIGAQLVLALKEAGVTATGYAALYEGDRLTGILSVASQAPDGADRMPGMLPLVEQLAGFSSIVLAKQAALFGEQEAVRRRVRKVLEADDVVTLLQPVVDMSTGEVQGYEALSRFADDRPPDVWMEGAHSVGLGPELEEACARSAILAARHISPEFWMCVNFSPEAIVGGSVGRSVLDAGRRIVVEVTEHTQVASYSDLRDEMKKYPGIDVSADDAGAGFAGLRHILELDPRFVKLDISMVRDVDKDPSRAAMVAGMVHFARATGTRLVAEGIETEAEAETLRILGVDLGQGYLFGIPQPPSEI